MFDGSQRGHFRLRIGRRHVLNESRIHLADLVFSNLRLVGGVRPNGTLQLVAAQAGSENLVELFAEVVVQPAVEKRVRTRGTHAAHVAEREQDPARAEKAIG